MRPYLVVYATRDGHTFRIADHIADALRERRLEVRARNVASWEPADLHSYSGVLLAAPVHVGIHAREMIHFVRSHCAVLLELSARLLSVSLYQAAVEAPDSPNDRRLHAAQKVRQYAAMFSAETGFPVARIIPVAGALVYSRYGLMKGFLMRRVAQRMGAASDSSRDHDYTSWRRIDALVDELAQEHGRSASGLSDPLSLSELDSPPGHRLHHAR